MACITIYYSTLEVGVFVKKYNGDDVTYDQVTRQIELLTTLNTLKKDDADPITPYFYGACKDDKHLYIVTEYFPGKDLFDYLQEQGGFLKMEEGKDIIREILIIIDVLHNQGNIVHRDLKMENFMLRRNSRKHSRSMKQNEFDVEHIIDRGTLKLIDFGDSRMRADSGMDSPDRGTQRYQAPEISARSYGKKVDIYSAGIMFLDMITGDTTDCTTKKLMKQSLNSIERDFVQKMVAEDPNERWSAKELLSHRFFSKSLQGYDGIRLYGLQKPMKAWKYFKKILQGNEEVEQLTKPNDESLLWTENF